MKDPQDITACVVDHGLFLHVAEKLAEQYHRVYYWSPYERVLPKLQEGVIGDGLNPIKRVSSFWDVKEECDLFVFPDIGFAGEQRELVNQGYPVWGHHGADAIESNRGLFLKLLEEVGLPVPPHEVCEGFDALKAFLRDEEDKFIKISRWRGNWETFHWRNRKLDGDELELRGIRLGPIREFIKFYVFDKLDAEVEDGIDTYFCGRFPKTVMHGLEKKDKSYLCAVQPMADIGDPVREAAEQFAPILERYRHYGFFSCEVRIVEGQGFFIDPTMRAASPVSQLMVELFGNLGAIVAAGAMGNCVEPEPTAKYGVQALISADREPDEWLRLSIPEEIRPWTKLAFSAGYDGDRLIPPHELGNMLGWLVAIGNTVREAIENLKEYRTLLPEGLECEVESIASLLIEAEKAVEEGVTIGDGEMPEPASVLEDQ